MSTGGNSSMTVVPGPHKKSFSSSIPRRTMASLNESPQVALVPESNIPASTPISLSRLILPFLGVAMGVSVGSAAGLTLALVNAPNQTVAASSDASPVSPASTVAENSVAMKAQPAQIMQPAANSVQSISNSDVAKSANVSLSTANSVTNANAQATVQIALNKTPDAVKPAMLRLAGKEWHVARPIALHVAQPAGQASASAPAVAPTALDTAQSGLDAAAKPAAIYSEGDLTVADFDAADGTLQASDGRIFVLGTTVAASYATSWDSYHSLVHDRCDETGSCVLMRAGAVAPNARLI
jgi:hypothetical protein